MIAVGTRFFFLFLLCVFICHAKLRLKDENELHGISLLDSITFPQLVPHPHMTIVLLLFNVNSKGEYGADSMREDFVHFANKGTKDGNGDNVLFAQVPVNDKEGTNIDIAKKLGVSPSFQFPRMFLFKAGNPDPIPYPESGKFNDASFTTFVARHSDFFLGIDGLEPRFEMIAKRFIAAHNIEYDSLIAEAEEALENLPQKQRVHADYYVKIMKKVRETGIDYVDKERKRLKKILKSENLSESKKTEQQAKLNIVSQFHPDAVPDL